MLKSYYFLYVLLLTLSISCMNQSAEIVDRPLNNPTQTLKSIVIDEPTVALIEKTEITITMTVTPTEVASSTFIPTPVSTTPTFLLSSTPPLPTKTANPPRNTSEPLILTAPSTATKIKKNAEEYVTNEDLYENRILGVQFKNQEGYKIIEQQYLSEVFGFSIVNRNGSHQESKLRVSWRIEAPLSVGDILIESPEDAVELLIEETLRYFPEMPSPERQIVEVGNNMGLALYPIPGTEPNTLIYVVTNERVYEIRYFGEIGEEAIQLLNQLVFVKPSEEFNPDNYPKAR